METFYIESTINMKFCSTCDNMFYVKINESDPNSLQYYCRKCGEIETMIDAGCLCVSSIKKTKTKSSFDHVVNEYTKLDPTLPRLNNVLCPNDKCSTNTEATEKETIYLRHDNEKMAYVYLCTICDFVWHPTK
jgi:DNA-directed RNA polymerase subunit M/transcription elongation factor TFIIS